MPLLTPLLPPLLLPLRQPFQVLSLPFFVDCCLPPPRS